MLNCFLCTKRTKPCTTRSFLCSVTCYIVVWSLMFVKSKLLRILWRCYRFDIQSSLVSPQNTCKVYFSSWSANIKLISYRGIYRYNNTPIYIYGENIKKRLIPQYAPGETLPKRLRRLTTHLNLCWIAFTISNKDPTANVQIVHLKTTVLSHLPTCLFLICCTRRESTR